MDALAKRLVDAPNLVVPFLTPYEGQGPERGGSLDVRIGKWILILVVDELEAEKAQLDLHVADLLDFPNPFRKTAMPKDTADRNGISNE